MLTSTCSAEVDHEAKVVRCVHVSCHVTSFRILWRGWQNIKVMHFKESPLPCSVAGAALLVCVHGHWVEPLMPNSAPAKILNWMCRNVDQLHRGVVWRLDTMPSCNHGTVWEIFIPVCLSVFDSEMVGLRIGRRKFSSFLPVAKYWKAGQWMTGL